MNHKVLLIAFSLLFCMSTKLTSQNIGVNIASPDHLLDIRSDANPGPVLNLGSNNNDLFFRFNSHNKFSNDPSISWKSGQAMKMFLGSSDGVTMTEFLRFDGERIGFYNTGRSLFIGENAGLNDDLSDNSNIAFGFDALKSSSTGHHNIAIGDSSLSATNSNGNIGIGKYSLSDHDSGDNNIGIGLKALQSHNSGSGNVAIGFTALASDLSGNSNVAIGRTSLRLHVLGDNNVAIGRSALFYNIMGSGNVALGHNAGLDEVGSNKLYIENSSSSEPLIYGEFDNDMIRINGAAEVTGRIKVGDDTTTPSAGMIRFNSTSGLFEGYDGTEWLPFSVQGGPFGSSSIMNVETDALQPNFSDEYANGESIAVAFDILVLGSPNFDDDLADGIGSGIGSVLIYKKSNGTWIPILELTDPANQVNSRFGYSVETDANKIIIGSPGYDSGANTDEGRVYVYKRGPFGFTWPLEQTLFSSASSNKQLFGDNLNLSGNDLIVGGPGLNMSPIYKVGRAVIFHYTSSGWSEQIALNSSTAPPFGGTSFGNDVAIEGNYAVVGAPGSEEAFIYERTGSTWSEVKILNVTESPAGYLDNFGTSVAISGTDIVVSAPGYEINGNAAQGQIWGFEEVVGNWLVSFTETAPEELAFCEFGQKIRSFNDKIIVSSGTSKLVTFNKVGSIYEYESCLVKKKLSSVTDFDLTFSTVASVKIDEDLIYYYE